MPLMIFLGCQLGPLYPNCTRTWGKRMCARMSRCFLLWELTQLLSCSVGEGTYLDSGVVMPTKWSKARWGYWGEAARRELPMHALFLLRDEYMHGCFISSTTTFDPCMILII
jgi:hypothetical protein